jgi:hypothetical protein
LLDVLLCAMSATDERVILMICAIHTFLEDWISFPF